LVRRKRNRLPLDLPPELPCGVGNRGKVVAVVPRENRCVVRSVLLAGEIFTKSPACAATALTLVAIAETSASDLPFTPMTLRASPATPLIRSRYASTLSRSPETRIPSGSTMTDKLRAGPFTSTMLAGSDVVSGRFEAFDSSCMPLSCTNVPEVA